MKAANDRGPLLGYIPCVYMEVVMDVMQTLCKVGGGDRLRAHVACSARRERERVVQPLFTRVREDVGHTAYLVHVKGPHMLCVSLMSGCGLKRCARALASHCLPCLHWTAPSALALL